MRSKKQNLLTFGLDFTNIEMKVAGVTRTKAHRVLRTCRTLIDSDRSYHKSVHDRSVPPKHRSCWVLEVFVGEMLLLWEVAVRWRWKRWLHPSSLNQVFTAQYVILSKCLYWYSSTVYIYTVYVCVHPNHVETKQPKVVLGYRMQGIGMPRSTARQQLLGSLSCARSTLASARPWSRWSLRRSAAPSPCMALVCSPVILWVLMAFTDSMATEAISTRRNTLQYCSTY